MLQAVEQAAVCRMDPRWVDDTRRVAGGQRHVVAVITQRRIGNQVARLADLFHDAVAGINAQCAGNTFELLAVADIDAGGTDRDASIAIDAITHFESKCCGLLGAAVPRLATPVIVGNDKRVFVKHGRLDARPGTHVDAHLLAHQATEDIGGGGEHGDCRIGDEGCLACQEVAGERWRIGKIENPGTTRGDGNQDPHGVLGKAPRQLVQRPGRRIEAHLGVAVAVKEALDCQEEISPHRLRARVSAPGAADDGSDKEQSDAGHHQEARHIDEFLRPYLDEEEIEAPVREIDQHRLVRGIRAAVPAQPGSQVIDGQCHRHH